MVVDGYEFAINRIWDINGCCPPCCPYTLLFEATDGSFVYLESWQQIERRESESGESKLVIESTPNVKRLIKARIQGQVSIKHDDQLRELNEFLK